ncbi:hypothetical protein ACFPM0_09620 [Pseudonocardia sulfidoxydans]|uniref:hypothetical protein n=1 Tax=Pseudonocardia sulfidoxydans TaxID=54011 RepID=UPI003617CE6E
MAGDGRVRPPRPPPIDPARGRGDRTAAFPTSTHSVLPDGPGRQTSVAGIRRNPRCFPTKVFTMTQIIDVIDTVAGPGHAPPRSGVREGSPR